MRPAIIVACTFFLPVVVLSGCGVDRAGMQVTDLGPGVDGGQLDLSLRDLGGADLARIDLGPDRDLGVEEQDLGMEVPDLGPTDLGPLDLGPTDLGPPDLGPPDLGPPDLGPPDLGRPDLGLATCMVRYSLIGSELLCSESTTECEFYAVLGGSRSCDDRCASGGGTCIRAFGEQNDGAQRCTHNGTETCGSDHNDGICVCSR